MKKYENMGKLWRKNRVLFYSICMGLMVVSCLQSLIKTYKYHEADQTYKQMEEVMVSKSADVRYEEVIAVAELNMIGWITIEQLDISYPMVQGEDNEFYLQHLIDGKSNASGSIMMNCDNQPAFTDRNTIIYGHNMKDGSMFGKLKNLLELSEPYDDFLIDTPGGELRCHIFAVADVEVSHSIYQINYSEESFEDCMQELKTASSYWEEPNDNTNIVTLSTCKGERRLVVVAYFTKD